MCATKKKRSPYASSCIKTPALTLLTHDWNPAVAEKIGRQLTRVRALSRVRAMYTLQKFIRRAQVRDAASAVGDEDFFRSANSLVVRCYHAIGNAGGTTGFGSILAEDLPTLEDSPNVIVLIYPWA